MWGEFLFADTAFDLFWFFGGWFVGRGLGFGLGEGFSIWHF